MKFIRSFIALTILLAVSSPAAQAAKKEAPENAALPQIEVRLSPEVQKKEKAFETAREKLSEEQDTLVTEMEQKFMSTVDPYLQTVQLKNDIAACGFEEEESESAEKKFSAFKQRNEDRQIELWGLFNAKYYPRVDFIDHTVLKEHLAVKLKIASTTAEQLIRLKAAQTKRSAQCEQAKETLSGIRIEQEQEQEQEEE